MTDYIRDDLIEQDASLFELDWVPVWVAGGGLAGLSLRDDRDFYDVLIVLAELFRDV